MTDTEVEGDWRWSSDGSEVMWFNWVVWTNGIPSGGDKENCAGMLKQYSDDIAGHRSDDWGDFPCDRVLATMKVVCEKGKNN